MLGSGLNKVSSVKTASQMRCPPGSSHYGHMQVCKKVLHVKAGYVNLIFTHTHTVNTLSDKF